MGTIYKSIRCIKSKYIVTWIKDQLSRSDWFRDLIVNRSAWGAFSIYAHAKRSDGKSKISYKSKAKAEKATFDMTKRSDDVIDVCEMKYYAEEYAFNQDEYAKLQNRMLRLAEETKTRKAVQAILITTYGLKQNEYSDIVQSVVTMNDLFLEQMK